VGLRVFVAARLDAEVRDALDAALARARETRVPALRWVSRESWHFTLQFLGDTPESRIPALRDALERAARASAPFEVVLAGAGAFPRPDHARVVWVGARDATDALRRLAADVMRETGPLGFTPEARPFHAHLTIARLKQPANVVPLLDAVRVPELVQPIREVVLYRSHLSAGGARYAPLATVPLGA
jgi:2'-5' RNA ligase